MLISLLKLIFTVNSKNLLSLTWKSLATCVSCSNSITGHIIEMHNQIKKTCLELEKLPKHRHEQKPFAEQTAIIIHLTGSCLHLSD